MDSPENNSRYTVKPYGVSNQQGYSSSIRQKPRSSRYAMYPRPDYRFASGEDRDVEGEKLRREGNGINGISMRLIGKDNYDEDDEEEEEEDSDDNVVGNDEEEDYDDGILMPHKKRKYRSLLSNYEFVPRVPAPSSRQPPVSRSPADWTEHETSVLLDAWGERFLKRGRNSLRSDEWQEVAEKVSSETNVERTDVHCRNRLEMLKKRYKKEKLRVMESHGGGASRWAFYKKMDMLMYSPQQLLNGLSCGVDSGEYVFMNPEVYLNRANGLDEMRDSPGNSEASADDEEDDADELLSKAKVDDESTVDSSSFRLLADSVQKLSDIYEKTEDKKRKQMVELEKMRMDFQRQIETHRQQILERAQAEIANIGGGDNEENDLSGEHLSD